MLLSRASSLSLALVSALVLHVSAATPPQKQKAPKQASPAQGNKSEQSVEVSVPLCDAYLPYQINGATQEITPIFPNAAPPTSLPPDTEIDKFLNTNVNIASPLTKDGTFTDPGYPILGDPQRHLYADGSDLSRLLARLIYSSGSRDVQPPVPLCGSPTQAPKAGDHPQSDYYLVHIVRWERSGASSTKAGSYVTSKSDWYIFNRDDGQSAHRQFPFTFHPYVTGDLRILGNSRVLFVAIHLAPEPPSCSGSDPKCDPSEEYNNFRKYVALTYKMTVSHVEPANIQDLKALFGVIVGQAAPTTTGQGGESRSVNPNRDAYEDFLSSSNKRPFAGVYAAAALTNLQNLPVQITSTMSASFQTISGKLDDAKEYTDPGFWDSLIPQKGTQVKPGNSGTTKNTNTKGKTGTAGSTGTPTGGANVGSSKTGNQPSSGCSTSGTHAESGDGSESKCSENVVVLDEGLHWWDVSVGIPFKGVNQLQYGANSAGEVTTQSVSKGSAYGFFVLAPWKEDIIDPPSLGIPHFLVGLPFTGKVFNNPFFGMGETFNLSKTPKIGNAIGKVFPLSIRLYAGIDYLKQFDKPSTGSGAMPPPPSHRVAKLQYGIEFSVKEIASKLTGKNSNSKPAASSKSGK
jgi:hypothetical protein